MGLSKTRYRMVREIRPHVELWRDLETGIAWIRDGSTGLGHTCHPNIDATGSIRGMRSRGHWGKDERAVRSHGFIYNVDSFVIDRESVLDLIVAAECQCVGCVARRQRMAEEAQRTARPEEEAAVQAVARLFRLHTAGGRITQPYDDLALLVVRAVDEARAPGGGAAARPEVDTALLSPHVSAEVHVDSDALKVEHFDATPYFAQASDEEIVALMECGFGGDYPADEVARFMEDQDEEVEFLFLFIDRTGEGFECHVDVDEARAWLATHRPHLLADPLHDAESDKEEVS